MRSPLTCQNANTADSRILIEATPLLLMDRFWQNEMDKPESGGILLGHRRGKHLHVTIATEPQPGDGRWRFFFNRSMRAHQDIALKKWRASGGTVDYLGEWHTHPEPHPSPSPKDYAEWRKICSRLPNPMLFMIVGWSGEVWLGCSNGQKVEQCNIDPMEVSTSHSHLRPGRRR